jgi:hypothetical protein
MTKEELGLYGTWKTDFVFPEFTEIGYHSHGFCNVKNVKITIRISLIFYIKRRMKYFRGKFY